MSRHFLVESVNGFKKAKDNLLRFFVILTVSFVVLLLALMTQASAQAAFPQGNDALAKFRWEQVAFSHYCVVGRLRAVNFNNLSVAQKAELARATEQEVIAAIRGRCFVRSYKTSGLPRGFSYLIA